MRKIYSIAALCLFAASAQAAIHSFSEGQYTVTYDNAAKEFTVTSNGTYLFKQAYAEVTYNILGNDTEKTISSKEIAAAVTTEDIDDCFGHGKSHVFVYKNDEATMRQYFNFYGDDKEYFICYNTISSNDGKTILQSRHFVPLAATDTYTVPFNSENGTVRMLWVPFDNDGHGRYHNYSFASMKEENSYSIEVGAAYNPTKRRGLVAGSVDHDKWKSAVQIYGKNNNRLYKFQLISGYTSANTRDVLPHGKVKGQTISSARFMVGLFDDWRDGMNTFGDCCTASTPRPVWNGGTPVGWSTYGVQQERVNENGVRDCADFLRDNFTETGFHDAQNLVSISFDACANDNISDYNIKQLIKNKFDKENMILGMYAGPMCLWPWALDSKIDGTGVGPNPDYFGRNIALKVNGENYPMPCNGALAVDPTHPAVKLNIEKFMKKWASWGVKYVKADFLNCGIIEGDQWYDPEITTGVMAYNYGMKLMYDIAEENGIYIVEAMSPLFPYNYAHGRRTCCDRFSKIDETEYVMNAISYGWWTDRLYTVNDPDQLVLLGRNNNKKETEGENRARATSGMATGAYIWGDNFSERCVHTDANEAAKQGVSVGDPVGWPEESKKRAMAILGNADVNEYVRTHTGSFMPVEGGDPTNYTNGSNQQSERLFYRIDDQYCYVAVFSFSKIAAYTGDLTWERLGIANEKIDEIKELWTGEQVEFNTTGFHFNVPKADARIYRIKLHREHQSGIESAAADNTSVSLRANGNTLTVESASEISSVEVYTTDGILFARQTAVNANTCKMNATPGVMIVRTALANGSISIDKLIN